MGKEEVIPATFANQQAFLGVHGTDVWRVLEALKWETASGPEKSFAEHYLTAIASEAANSLLRLDSKFFGRMEQIVEAIRKATHEGWRHDPLLSASLIVYQMLLFRVGENRQHPTWKEFKAACSRMKDFPAHGYSEHRWKELCRKEGQMEFQTPGRTKS